MPTRMAHNSKMAAIQAFRSYEDKGDEHGNYCIILDIYIYGRWKRKCKLLYSYHYGPLGVLGKILKIISQAWLLEQVL